jgi:hypothetical protein
MPRHHHCRDGAGFGWIGQERIVPPRAGLNKVTGLTASAAVARTEKRLAPRHALKPAARYEAEGGTLIAKPCKCK